MSKVPVNLRAQLGRKNVLLSSDQKVIHQCLELFEESHHHGVCHIVHVNGIECVLSMSGFDDNELCHDKALAIETALRFFKSFDFDPNYIDLISRLIEHT